MLAEAEPEVTGDEGAEAEAGAPGGGGASASTANRRGQRTLRTFFLHSDVGANLLAAGSDAM